MGDLRQRVTPGLFTDVDREWRKKWLKAHELSVKEKSMHFYYLYDNPEFQKARFNPIRRVWQAPGNALERSLRPMMGLQKAFMARRLEDKDFQAPNSALPRELPQQGPQIRKKPTTRL